MPRPRAKNPRRKLVNFRLTDNEYSEMQESAEKAGFESLSDYLRHLHA
ncbi:MAG: plasmid mobilization protein, partial [Acidobacteriota bacterium]